MEQKDEIVKATILEAGARVFQKWGLNKTTMEDIAKEAGKGKSTLYYYYKSKEDIFYNVAMNIVNNILNKAQAEIEKAASAEEKLNLYTKIFTDEVKAFINLYEILYSEIKGYPTVIEKIRENLDAMEIRLIKRILSFGIKNKEFKQFKDKELNNVSYIIVNAIRSLQLNLFLNKKETDFEKVPLLINIILKGVKI